MIESVSKQGQVLSDLENGGQVSQDDDGQHTRTGTAWTAAAHVITAVIGSGVLSLAWSMAQLGWIAGPLIMLSFAVVTYYTSVLLADCYRSPDPVTGTRNYTYMDAVKATLGGHQIWICGVVQYLNLVGTSIGYTITGAISMVAVLRSNCFQKHGHSAPCRISNDPSMVAFGLVQILLSQIPDFDKIWWLSILASVMSFVYSFIGLGLTVAKTIGQGQLHGTATGVSAGPDLSQLQRFWQAFQALGNIAFAYSFSMILIEIQDTLKSPPAENKSMKKASLIGIITTTMFYMAVGSFGYAAFGNSAPGNLLTGFNFYNPYWLVDIANACIVIHLLGAYQVYSQPVFAFVEGWAAKKWTRSSFIQRMYKVPVLGELNMFRLVWRTLFVFVTTFVSSMFPFFNDVLGLLGAAGFWPLTVYFPIKMYEKQTKVQRWSAKWIGLESLSMVTLLISIAAGIGSIQGIASAFKTYKFFETAY